MDRDTKKSPKDKAVDTSKPHIAVDADIPPDEVAIESDKAPVDRGADKLARDVGIDT